MTTKLIQLCTPFKHQKNEFTSQFETQNFVEGKSKENSFETKDNRKDIEVVIHVSKS